VPDSAGGTNGRFAVLSIQIRVSSFRFMAEHDTYHRKALHCVRTAEHLHDPGERAKLLEIARAYLGLARHVAERHASASAHRLREQDAQRVDNA
jgi:hypothetical protein